MMNWDYNKGVLKINGEIATKAEKELFESSLTAGALIGASIGCLAGALAICSVVCCFDIGRAVAQKVALKVNY